MNTIPTTNPTPLEELMANWASWLRRRHGYYLSPQAMKNIREQGDHLLRTNVRFRTEEPMQVLYDEALARVTEYSTNP